MIYIVTDRNNKDRADFIVDSFDTRAEAEAFAAQLSADNGGEEFAVEEFESLEAARGEDEEYRSEEETLSEILEAEFQPSPSPEIETGIEFENWIQSGNGFVLFNDEFYAKSDATGETEIYRRNQDGSWSQYS